MQFSNNKILRTYTRGGTSFFGPGFRPENGRACTYLALSAIPRSSFLPLSFAFSFDRDRPACCCCSPVKSTGSSVRLTALGHLSSRRHRGYSLNCRTVPTLNAPRSWRFTCDISCAICRLPAMAISIINTCSTTVIHRSLLLSPRDPFAISLALIEVFRG